MGHHHIPDPNFFVNELPKPSADPKDEQALFEQSLTSTTKWVDKDKKQRKWEKPVGLMSIKEAENYEENSLGGSDIWEKSLPSDVKIIPVPPNESIRDPIPEESSDAETPPETPKKPARVVFSTPTIPRKMPVGLNTSMPAQKMTRDMKYDGPFDEIDKILTDMYASRKPTNDDPTPVYEPVDALDEFVQSFSRQGSRPVTGNQNLM